MQELKLFTPVNDLMTHRKQQKNLQNGDNSFAGVYIPTLCCKSVSTIILFYFIYRLIDHPFIDRLRPISNSPVSEDNDDNNNTGNNDDQQQQPHTNRDANDQPSICINTLLASIVNTTECKLPATMISV